MKKLTNFRFNDIVLYAKCWYQRKDIVEDLGYLFSQIYGWTPTKEQEIADMMVRVLDKLYIEMDIPQGYCEARFFNTHYHFENEVRKYMWIYECSREKAIIQLVLGVLQGLSKDEIDLEPPYYGKHEHFRLGSLGPDNPISMTYTQMNRMAEKAFGKESKKKLYEQRRSTL